MLMDWSEIHSGHAFHGEAGQGIGAEKEKPRWRDGVFLGRIGSGETRGIADTLASLTLPLPFRNINKA